MRQGGTDFVLVASDTELEEEYISSVSSTKLIRPTGFNPQREARRYGTVVQIPRHLSETPIGFRPQGTPPVKNMASLAIHMKGIKPEVQIGDRVYFHYSVLAEADRSRVQDGIYAVRYDQIYCRVHSGGRSVKDDKGIPYDYEQWTMIDPVGGWVLCEPVEETEADIRTKSGIFTKPEPGKKYLIGKVAHIGIPVEGDVSLLGTLGCDDYVMLRKHADHLVKIEGNDYYVCQQRNIILKGELEDLKMVEMKK